MKKNNQQNNSSTKRIHSLLIYEPDADFIHTRFNDQPYQDTFSSKSFLMNLLLAGPMCNFLSGFKDGKL